MPDPEKSIPWPARPMCMHMLGGRRPLERVPVQRNNVSTAGPAAGVLPQGSRSGRSPRAAGGPPGLVRRRDILGAMGRDSTRVLIGAVVSIALILGATLVMDWYQISYLDRGDVQVRIAIGLANAHRCDAERACSHLPLSQLSGMYATMAFATLWSSLGLAALVAFQAGARVFSGSASEAFTKLGYLYALMTIAIATTAAYVFAPEVDLARLEVVAELGGALHRSWAPATLIAGLIAGFATLYMAVAPDSGDDGAAYKPITVAPARAASEDGALVSGDDHAEAMAFGADALLQSRSRTPTVPIPLRGRPPTGSPGFARSPTEPPRGLARPPTDPPRGLARPPTDPPRGLTRAPTAPPVPDEGPIGSRTGTHRAVGNATGPHRASENTGVHRVSENTGVHRAIGNTGAHRAVGSATGSVPALGRAKSGPLPAAPEHLRHRLSYVALTAELTAGGIDARREDGSARLVLWRDVVGVVARRMPVAYASTLFVDIVSSAGSTLRIVPWTRLTGEPTTAEGDALQREIVERAVARCPTAQIDAATQQFLEGADAAQLPDLETLAAHDAHLA